MINVKDLADRTQANLNPVFTGTEKRTIIVSPETVTSGQNIIVDNFTN